MMLQQEVLAKATYGRLQEQTAIQAMTTNHWPYRKRTANENTGGGIGSSVGGSASPGSAGPGGSEIVWVVFNA
jgi:hypothetical protein